MPEPTQLAEDTIYAEATQSIPSVNTEDIQSKLAQCQASSESIESVSECMTESLAKVSIHERHYVIKNAPLEKLGESILVDSSIPKRIATDSDGRRYFATSANYSSESSSFLYFKTLIVS